MSTTHKVQTTATIATTTAYGVCIVCGMPNEPDGYCEDGCVLWVGSNEPVTVDTVGRESGVWWS